MERIAYWRRWLLQSSPETAQVTEREQRTARMLLAQLLDQVAERNTTLGTGAEMLWRHPQVRAELVELLGVLADRITHVATPLDGLPDIPLQVHARYTRHEILAACGVTEGVKSPTWREGVRFAAEVPADLFAFTFDKTSGQFSPTTRYRDYAISSDLIHWESQSTSSSRSTTGQRYRNHERDGSSVFLFARINADDDRAFYFLGPGTYVSHTGDRPMAITWRLRHPLPGDLFASFAAAVA
jgi:hypothetical protein